MSSSKIKIQNDNQDVEKSNISEQTSPYTTIHMHATEDEEENVCGSVLHKEETSKTGRSEFDTKITIEDTIPEVGVFGIAPNEEYAFCHGVGRQDQNPKKPYKQPPYGKQGPYYGEERPKAHNYGWPVAVYSYGEGEPVEYLEDSDRNAFVRKVTIILLVALTITAGFVTTVMVVPRLKWFFMVHGFLLALPAAICLMVLSCVLPISQCARQPPTNYILFSIVVILQSLLCAALTVLYKTNIVLWALMTTVIVVFICVILACTSFDFTKFLIYVIVISVALSALSIIMLTSYIFFGVYSKPVHIAISFAVTLVEVVFLIIELQMVLGGKSIELTEDDYILGAYMLYMSIIDIFIQIMSLLSKLND